jgi:hypothetical protein
MLLHMHAPLLPARLPTSHAWTAGRVHIACTQTALIDLWRAGALTGGAVGPTLAIVVQTAPLQLVMLVAYPAVFQLHASGWGDRGADGRLVLPPTVPASSQYLEQHGAYLVDCGYICFLWIGQLATPELVKVRSVRSLQRMHAAGAWRSTTALCALAATHACRRCSSTC